MDSISSQPSTTAELQAAHNAAVLAGQPQQTEHGINQISADMPDHPSAAYPSPGKDLAAHPAQNYLPAQHDQHNRTGAAATAVPPSDWMAQCCSDMHLRQMFLPGSHDSGTFMWTTPKHMPMVLDEILSILFNIVGDLSRTQRLDVYQ
jgi:hypothetical protein